MYVIRQCKNRIVSVKGMATAPNTHYESLGIKRNATQGEIKTAYYELSKMFHPDTNKGSQESLAKFRQVNDAYEVLGNVKSRKMYDRGLAIGGSGSVRGEDVEDDPTTRFYQKREKRSQVPFRPESGPTVYDFDAWTKAHYSKTRDRRAAAKERYNEHIQKKVNLADDSRADLIFIAVSVTIVAYAALTMIDVSEDQNRIKSVQKIVER